MSNLGEMIPSESDEEQEEQEEEEEQTPSRRLWRILVREDLANRRVLGRINRERMKARGCQLFRWHQDYKNPPWLIGILLFEKPVSRVLVDDFLSPSRPVYDSEIIQHTLQARHVPDNQCFICREMRDVREQVWHAIIPRHRYALIPLLKLDSDRLKAFNLERVMVYPDDGDKDFLHVIFLCLKQDDEWAICADVLRTHPLICLPSIDPHYDCDQENRSKNDFYMKIAL